MLRAGAHQDLAGRVIERVRGHGFHDGNVVHNFGKVRQRILVTMALLVLLGATFMRSFKEVIQAGRASRAAAGRRRLPARAGGG